ncbi:uncharacterized protein LOC124457879 [Xenia sp. Carnegie-2017]|uniref:uncharacterized protein LOC124457879 n=1 Tax=Xenia sp. Carnegie-2017 TaxID=2897299 RepID=UPI001F03B29D|nr:uncharacterized protein LOC124457879 [Xenia sp. Carnegie-2017]
MCRCLYLLSYVFQVQFMALTCIPIVDIHAENITENWPSLIFAIKSATFIALDLEMSGIGNRKDTMTRFVPGEPVAKRSAQTTSAGKNEQRSNIAEIKKNG